MNRPLRSAVPDGEDEHAPQVLEHRRTVLAIGVEQDLGVAVRAECMPARGKLGAQRREVVDLTVEDDGQRAIGRAHRLRASLDVDHREPPVSERERSVAVIVARIGPRWRSRSVMRSSACPGSCTALR